MAASWSVLIQDFDKEAAGKQASKQAHACSVGKKVTGDFKPWENKYRMPVLTSQ